MEDRENSGPPQLFSERTSRRADERNFALLGFSEGRMRDPA
jgi:hypothetical protein